MIILAPGTLERITWVDHHHGHGSDWWDAADVIERVEVAWEITTVGEVIHEDERCVTVIHERHTGFDGKVEYRGWTSIMKALILKREVLHP